MLVKDFLKKYPNDNFQMMTPGGYVDLSPQQAKELLAGKPVAAHPGESGCKMMLDAEELLMAEKDAECPSLEQGVTMC